jgi:phosphopantothenoylcysteine decarboxylase
MNTHMYTHPLTSKHLDVVQKELGYKVYGPIQKGLACGDIGVGAMYEWSDIVRLVVDQYKLQKGDQG